MTRVYISGPISGKPNLNKDAFDHEERLLREVGYDVFNPHSITRPSEETLQEWWAVSENVESRYREKEWQYYMRICIGQIPLCDEMLMLPNWQNSKGSVWEHRIAHMLGMPIRYCPVTEESNW